MSDTEESCPPLSKRNAILVCLMAPALLVGVFWLFFSNYDPYRSYTLNLIEGGDFERNVFSGESVLPRAGSGGSYRKGLEALSHDLWRAWGSARWAPHSGFLETAAVRLEGGPEGVSAIEYLIKDPRTWSHLRFSGRIRTEDIRSGEAPWHAARLILFFRDDKGLPHWEHEHVMCSLVGNQAWQKFSKVFAIPDYAVTAHVCAQNSGVSGTAWVDELSVVAVVRKASEVWWRSLAGILWATVAILCIHSIQLLRRRHGRIILMVAVVIVVGAIWPNPSIKDAVEKGKASVTRGVIAKKGPSQRENRLESQSAANLQDKELSRQYDAGRDVNVFKTGGHVLLFALLSLFASLSCRWECYSIGAHSGAVNGGTPVQASRHDFKCIIRTIFVLFTGLALFAGATEVLQYLSETRQPEIHGWLFDLAGITLGFGASLLWNDAVRTWAA